MTPVRRNHWGFNTCSRKSGPAALQGATLFGVLVPVVSPPANTVAHVPCAGMPSCLVPDNNSDFCNSLS